MSSKLLDKNITDDDIWCVLVNLVVDGKLKATCPICMLPIGIEELIGLNCDKCGALNCEKVLFDNIKEQRN